MQSEMFKPKILRRERIYKMVSQIFEVPVFFLSAPIGYGKTTIVSEFLKENNKVNHIWISMNQIGDNKIDLWEKICNSICSIDYELGKCLRKIGFPNSERDYKEIRNLIMQKKCGKIVIVLDDYGQAIDFYFHNILKDIMNEIIPDIHFVLLSRENIGEEYIELELKRKCVIISKEDIKFTVEETIDLFEKNKLEVSNEEVEKLYLHTLGWIAAIYFSMISYEKGYYLEDMSKPEEIIRSVVYNKLDESQKYILLALTPVKEFTVEDIIEITKVNEASKLIIKFEKENKFIYYNLKTKKYYYHPILRDILLKELIKDYSLSRKVYDNCASWYLSNSEYTNAIECYQKNKNYDSILKIFEKYRIGKDINISIQYVEKIFNEIPFEVKIKNPESYLYLIYFYIINIDFDEGKDILYKTKEYYEQDNNINNKEFIIERIALMEYYLSFNDLNNIEKYIQTCTSIVENKLNLFNNKMPFIFGIPNFIALYHKKQGNLNKSVQAIIETISYIKKVAGDFGNGLDYLIKGEYYFEIGNFEEAKVFAYKALYKAKIDNSINIIICAYFLICRLDLCFNKSDELRIHLEELKNEEKKIKNKNFLGQLYIAKSYIYGILNDPNKMNKYLKKYEELSLQKTPLMKCFIYIIYAMKCILNNEYIKFEVLVEELKILNLKCENIFISVYINVFDSIVKDRMYKDYTISEEIMINAINLSKNDNVIMPFVEFYQYTLPIMNKIKNKDEYVFLLINKCERRKEKFDENLKQEQQIIKLTARELEVMRLVEEGYSQSEISEKLHIALTTVKKHTSSVYSKVNAKNKIAAIRILKEKKII